MKLFWMNTRPHSGQSFFVLSKSKESALTFYGNGIDTSKFGLQATEICEVGKLTREIPCYVDLDTLKKLGFRVVSRLDRVVSRDGRIYRFGERGKYLLKKELGVYVVNILGTSFYKVGFTNDIKRRIDELQVANPHPIELYHFFFSNYPRLLEHALHVSFRKYKFNNEWFKFNAHALAQLERIIAYAPKYWIWDKEAIKGVETGDYQENYLNISYKK